MNPIDSIFFILAQQADSATTAAQEVGKGMLEGAEHSYIWERVGLVLFVILVEAIRYVRNEFKWRREQIQLKAQAAAVVKQRDEYYSLLYGPQWPHPTNRFDRRYHHVNR